MRYAVCKVIAPDVVSCPYPVVADRAPLPCRSQTLRYSDRRRTPSRPRSPQPAWINKSHHFHPEAVPVDNKGRPSIICSNRRALDRRAREEPCTVARWLCAHVGLPELEFNPLIICGDIRHHLRPLGRDDLHRQQTPSAPSGTIKAFCGRIMMTLPSPGRCRHTFPHYLPCHCRARLLDRGLALRALTFACVNIDVDLPYDDVHPLRPLQFEVNVRTARATSPSVDCERSHHQGRLFTVAR